MTGLSETIGSRVAAARNRRRQSIDDLAAISGLSAIDLQLIEFGQVRPSPRQLRLLARALDVEWLYFLPSASMPDESESAPGIGDLRKRVARLVSETDDEELLQGILALLRAEKVRSAPQDEGISAPMS